MARPNRIRLPRDPRTYLIYIPGRFRSSQFQNITISNRFKQCVTHCAMLDIQLLHLTQTARCSAPGRKRMKRKEHARTNFTSAACNLPCWDPQRKRCWCYPINLLSWDSCSKVWLLNAAICCLSLMWTFCLHAHATHSMVPGPLGQFDDDDLIVNRTTRTTLYFFFHKNNGTGVQSNDATLQPAQEMSVALFFFNGCYQFLFTGWGFRNNKCLAGASVFSRDTAASIGV